MKTNKKSCFLNEGIPQKCIWGTGPRKCQNLKQQQSSILNGTNLENITSMPEGHLPTSQVTEQNNFAISEFHQQQESGIQLRSRIRSTVIEIDLNSF